jgi:hypothetical protein
MTRVLREDIEIQSDALKEALGNLPKNEFDVLAEARKGLQRMGDIPKSAEVLTEDTEEEDLVEENNVSALRKLITG